MKKKLILYPAVARRPQSYLGIKSETVPDQAMSLHEIIRRFTRGESLPIEHRGVYETRFPDLEKLRDADIFERQEQIEYIRESVAAFEKRQAQIELDKLTQTPKPQTLEPTTS